MEFCDLMEGLPDTGGSGGEGLLEAAATGLQTRLELLQRGS
jgi:hypothetical protein